MGLFRRLWKNRARLGPILDALEEIGARVRNVAELRERFAEKVAAGDLDDAIAKFAEGDAIADAYRRNG